MKTSKLRVYVEKMDCPTEEKLIRKALEPMPQVKALSFNLLERELSIEHAFDTDAPIIAKLDELAMGPRVLEAGAQSGAQQEAPRSLLQRYGLLAVSGVAALTAELIALGSGADKSWPVIGLALVSLATGGLGTLKKGFIAVKSLTLNINFLMSVAIAGAIVIGEWPEAAMVIFLFALAEAIEQRSLERARDAVRELVQMTPPTAWVRRDDDWREVDAKTVVVGERLRVRPGEKFPLDGKVATGESSVNQAPITGESMPVTKQVGDPIFAGTLNGEGLLEVEVTSIASDTTLARIVRSIQDAQSERAPTQRFVDQFAKFYTPIVVVVAVLVAVVPPLAFSGDWQQWIYRALVLLVVACPCALVISTPVTVVSGLAAAARRGILIKGGVYLEEGRKLRVIAVDKTGTLTHGKPAVTEIVPLQGQAELDVLKIAAELEQASDHPVALAVMARWAELDGGALRQPTDFSNIAGKGIEGKLDASLYILGSHRLAEERGVCSPETEQALERLEASGKTTMVLASESGAIAVLGVADAIRETSREAVAQLKALGIQTIMLTGDNQATAKAVASEVGVDDVRAQLLPDDKVAAIRGLVDQYEHVGMVGDGINDAPALALSSIGFAMGAAGTDTAIETADVALMADDLKKLPEFILLSRKTARILKQNISFAIGTKAAFLALAATGYATLWMAILADLGASLVVVANGLRILRNAPQSLTEGPKRHVEPLNQDRPADAGTDACCAPRRLPGPKAPGEGGAQAG